MLVRAILVDDKTLFVVLPLPTGTMLFVTSTFIPALLCSSAELHVLHQNAECCNILLLWGACVLMNCVYHLSHQA